MAKAMDLLLRNRKYCDLFPTCPLLDKPPPTALKPLQFKGLLMTHTHARGADKALVNLFQSGDEKKN